jgi:DNA-binding beta-propeller fold protein YncE
VAAHVSVINTTTRAVAGTLPLPTGSHSLRGMCMAPGGGSLYVSHVLSRYYAPTTQVTRGWMNTNALTVINPATATRVNTILLDDLNQGAPNPWGVACSADGAWLCVAHAGNHEISAIDRVAFEAKLATFAGDASTDLTWLAGLRTRIPLGGNGPRGLAVAAGKVFAAQYFSDSLGIADLPGGGSPVGREITVGWRKPADAVRLGEMFYNDARLCLQQWQSCASCHPDARADGLNWDLLNDGFGNPKNTKSHIASMATPPAMATGIRANSQVAVRSGLRYIQFVNRDESYAAAIDAYLAALAPVPSPYLVDGQLSPAAVNGQAHFHSAKCADCHHGPAFTDLKKYEMGTGIGGDAGVAFDTPTLLEIWRSAPYLHDGRSATLHDVIVTGGHGEAAGLTPAEIDELILYLLSL